MARPDVEPAYLRLLGPNQWYPDDILPGFTTRAKITPTREGDFEIVCTELCGLGHYKMRGEAHVLKPEAFEDWLSKQMTFGG